MLDVLDVMTRLGEVKNKTAEALRATEADGGASIVTGGRDPGVRHRG
jgi:hypothetical protein